jgi:hypothetical protein
MKKTKAEKGHYGELQKQTGLTAELASDPDAKRLVKAGYSSERIRELIKQRDDAHASLLAAKKRTSELEAKIQNNATAEPAVAVESGPQPKRTGKREVIELREVTWIVDRPEVALAHSTVSIEPKKNRERAIDDLLKKHESEQHFNTLVGAFRRSGLSEEEARIAARGRQ